MYVAIWKGFRETDIVPEHVTTGPTGSSSKLQLRVENIIARRN